MILFGYCRKCDNRGYVLERGDVIPRDQLTPTQYAESMIEGGFFYRAIKVPCPNLSNPKHRSD